MRISVVIPLYNASSTILRAVDSVISQGFSPLEIIVVNDGSTDGSERKVLEIGYPLIKLVNQQNAGVSVARNKGISEASGDWIAFLDSDDIWLPDHLMIFKFLSERYPFCQVLACAYFIQDHNGHQKKIDLKKIHFKGEDGVINNYFEMATYSNPPIHSSSVAVKKSALISTGGFPPGVRSGEDLLTWARLAVNYDIAYSLNPESIFIMDPAHSYDMKPNRLPQVPDIVGNELTNLSAIHKDIPGIRKYTAHWFKMRASIYLRLGMKKQATREVFKSLSFRLTNTKIFFYILMLLLPVNLVNLVFKKLGKP